MTDVSVDMDDPVLILVGSQAGVDAFIARATLLGIKAQFVKADELLEMQAKIEAVDELACHVSLHALPALKTLDELATSIREADEELRKLGKELAKEPIKPEKTSFKTARNRIICNRRYC